VFLVVYSRYCGGSEWESNPPSPSEITIYGFEDRESHRTPCASTL
jgi:hypothetical protein